MTANINYEIPKGLTTQKWHEHRAYQKVYNEHPEEINKIIKEMYPEYFI